MVYTKRNLEAQRRIAAASLEGEHKLLARLPQVHADVRANHERTIKMRIAHYEKRIADLDTKLLAMP